jgi:D-glycero-D-manno-heptose 1,7-bisphosphate phosphatase
MAAGLNRRALLTDRDGTLIEDVGYLRDPDQVRLLPGVAPALAALARQGFELVMVSNQSGVGRGLITPSEAELVHRRLVTLLAEAGVALSGSYYCPHAPEEGCECRKPRPGMLLRAMRDLRLDGRRCFMIGDKPSDLEAGVLAGCKTILLAGDGPAPASQPRPDYTALDWSGVLNYLTHTRLPTTRG